MRPLLVALAILVIAGVSWAGYYGWGSLRKVEDQLDRVQAEQSHLADRVADLRDVVAVLTLELTDETLTEKLNAIVGDVSDLQRDLDGLRSLTSEQSQRITELDTSVATHDQTLDQITGPFWSSIQDRNLDELEESVAGIETYLNQLNGQLSNIETYLDEVDEGLRRIERCLSSVSEFLPGC